LILELDLGGRQLLSEPGVALPLLQDEPGRDGGDHHY
jgi:hypothetical protein